MKSFWWRLSMGVLILAALLVIHAFGVFDWLTLAYVQEQAQEARLWVITHAVAAPIGYMGFVFLATAFFVPVTALATIASGYLFGVVAGVCYTIVAVTLGSIVVLLMVRHGLGRSLFY